LEHIFDDFGQLLTENSRLFGGTGRVSPLLKINEQDGTIHVESKLGKDLPLVFN
jgi:hypothetical protein